MRYTIEKIVSVINGEWLSPHQDDEIEYLLTDSRKVSFPSASIFFALTGPRRNGHQFIAEIYRKGVRNFIVSEKPDTTVFPEANFILVDDTLIALQQLAAHHRSQFDIPVIGITGSNGKTIVKEWLYQLLHEDYNIARSPKSYNSQIGVPLSVWQMNEQHTLAIFEAGISQQGEMIRLEKIIKPTIGILTNTGEAHSEGFVDSDHKFREKISLFRNAEILTGREIDFESRKDFLEMLNDDLKVMTWGTSKKNDFVIRAITKKENAAHIFILHDTEEQEIIIPFTDDASVENAIACFCILKYLKVSSGTIKERMKKLQPVSMRLEMKKGINHCTIINDSYSADISSLEIALNFLDQQNGASDNKTVILSDFLQSALQDEELYEIILQHAQKHKVSRFIGIGEKISSEIGKKITQAENLFRIELFSSTQDFIKQFRYSHFKEEVILVKGARIFEFEKIVQLLEQKVHQTVLEINLNAIIHNLKEYQKFLQPSAKVMAMVKAYAYGSGGVEIAGILQYHKVDYLAVAYVDEGVELRKAGITIPIMVMNPDENSFNAIVESNLEPEIYSFGLLRSLDAFLQREGVQQYPIHIEVETGMNRLGFEENEIEKLSEHILHSSSFKIQSVFSHLAASEDPKQDEFTREQFHLFNEAAKLLQQKLNYPFLKHIANSAASIRFPEMQMDMVRLGIGLYGIDNTETDQLHLQNVATLRSTIAQLKELKAGDSVSYNRSGRVEKDSLIATIRIGYADGYSRKFGNAVGKIMVNGQLVPVIGTVCMDMMMIDVTNVPGVKEGDEVIVFGENLSIEKLSEWIGTIPYEIMTGISQRVKRIYYEE